MFYFTNTTTAAAFDKMEFNSVAVRVLSRGDVVVIVSSSSDFLFFYFRVPHPEQPLRIEMTSMPRIQPDLFLTHTCNDCSYRCVPTTIGNPQDGGEEAGRCRVLYPLFNVDYSSRDLLKVTFNADFSSPFGVVKYVWIKYSTRYSVRDPNRNNAHNHIILDIDLDREDDDTDSSLPSDDDDFLHELPALEER